MASSQGGDFRFRTGDRYLGGQSWEHYLAFEQYRTSNKATKLSMIRLGSDDVPEDVVIRPGLRYAIVKVTNGTMTARKGVWSWTAQEVNYSPAGIFKFGDKVAVPSAGRANMETFLPIG